MGAKFAYTRHDSEQQFYHEQDSSWCVLLLLLVPSPIHDQYVQRFACGNVVVKPSDVTPLRTCELIQVAGFPPDVVNIVTGYGVKVGEAIARYPPIDKVTSTGLALTGKKIIQTSRETSLKKDTLERISYLMMPTLTKQ